MKPLRTAAFLIVVALLVVPALQAQDWAGKGRMQGQVTDPDGNPLVGVKITLTKDGVEGKGPKPLTSNKKGRWSVLGLSGGNWTAVLEHEGFHAGEGTVKVNEFGSGPNVPVVLRPITEEEIQQAAAKSAVGVIDEGNALLEGGNYAEARAKYEEAIAGLEEEHQAPLMRGIARTYFQEGNTDKAIETLDKAIALAPEDLDSLRLIINLLVASDREADAKVYMDRLPEGMTVDSDTLLNIGIKAYNDNELEVALETFDRVVAENPENADAYYYRGLCHLNSGSSPEAKADFGRMLEIAPDHPNAGEAKQFLEYLETSG